MSNFGQERTIQKVTEATLSPQAPGQEADHSSRNGNRRQQSKQQSPILEHPS